MGEHEGWGQPGGLLPNGLLPSETASVTRILDVDRWAKAEERTAELIACIQPNPPSEERRNAVANYVQRLITKCFSCQVFTFGSVPLKTYLPDGDIDLTAMSENESLKDTWAIKVRDILESEERSENAEFHVKEVQYIQAEVKIIKCLVENIVVDISFNQVGGLCTLCFLEEIDHLINQNHLFKRSIILIKAWCYYESRILGAHHGLISTYALETLVLYIFHVFNNSFAGPLEVLYRFLEFFSNFNWENFCVSLSGPVPTSSLPDMTAEPPRKDSGELLLNKIFLDTCGSVYAVFPGGQESQGQPFVSKHFNVIDPLRTNNNLGRSVSKGNFFRIRSAFSFGAKKLARLLDCPKENLIAEVNQFFMNTWERHGSGHRPDASNPSLLRPLLLKSVPVDESNNSRSTASIRKKSNIAGSWIGHEHQSDGDLAFPGSSSQVYNPINQQSRNMHRTGNSFVASRSQSQRTHGSRVNSNDYEQIERNISSSGPVQTDRDQKILSYDYSGNDHEGKGRFQFARTQSSPELTEESTKVLSQGTHSRVVEMGKKQNTFTKLDYESRRNNLGTEVSSSHSVRSLDDPSSLRHGLSYQSLEPIVDSDSLSNIYHDDTGFPAMGEDSISLSESLEMHQEAQDLVNMMSSSRLHNYSGPVQLPMHLASPHLPLPLSPVLASMGYTQRNMAGLVSPNMSLIDPSWGSSLQFTQGFFSSPLSQYYPTARLNSNLDDMVESGNESSVVTVANPEADDHDIWHENNAGSTSGFDHENEGFQMLHSDDKQQSSVGAFNYVPSSRGSNSGSSVMRSQHKFVRENTQNRVPGRYDYTDASRYQTSRDNNTNSHDSNSMRFSPVSRASSRSKIPSESSRDGSLTKVSKPVRDNWGTKSASSSVMTSVHGKAKSGWQSEGSSDNVSAQEDDDSRDWVPLSTMNTEITERVTGSASLSPAHARSHQLSGYEPSQISGPDSSIPVAPLLVGSSRPRAADNSGVVPFAFYPTGPPVPFLTMLPVYNFPSDTGNSDGSRSQLDRDGREGQNRITLSNQDFDSAENLDLPEAHACSTSLVDVAPEHSIERKPDILNSDFGSHWQNLQFGRRVQNIRTHGPLIYSSPVVVPPVYLQGNYSWDGGPGRPLSGNMIPQMMGYGPRLVPVMPLQAGPSRPSGVFQCYGDEAPRYRGGTGTFLPNPKVNFKDRRFSSTRNHRGNYTYDRSEHADREGSWVSSKARAAGRSHGRNQTEKSNSRLDRSIATENRADKLWDSYRRDPIASREVQNRSLGSSNSSHSSANMAYSMYSLPAVGSNGVNPTGHAVPSVVMLYPYDQGFGYDSPAEQLDVGPVNQSGMSEIPRPNDGSPVRSNIYQQRHGTYRGGSPRTSPDQPSSPQVQRSTVQRTYQLKADDFPSLSFPFQEGSDGGNNYTNRSPRYQTFFFNPSDS